MNFQIWQFALAGAICAAGPIIIHLLNRRRYRVVHWAAMDFLREALQRNRRMMQMRDLILLAIRTAAVALFGLALAQPFMSAEDEPFDKTKPLHAVLVIDNSMSMAFETDAVGENLLDQARAKARQFIEQLPDDSRVSIIPLCGSRHGYSPDPYTKENAAEALDAIEVVDRSASVQRAVNEALKACETGPPLARRVVFLGDQQQTNWQDVMNSDQFDQLPSTQVVDISPGHWDNVWVSEFRVQDDLADVETPTTFVARLHYNGQPGPDNALRARDVQVTLSVEGQEVAAKAVTLEPGGAGQEVTFEHVLSSYSPQPGAPVQVPVRVAVSEDRLPGDNQRDLVVHVVAALPVVFIDQYGEREDRFENRIGETRHLRKLLAPVLDRRAETRQLVKIRHISLDELNQSVLEDARAVVIAGIESPGDRVTLLRDYVRQGGHLLVAAGGDFDPAAWTSDAWLDGDGILPAPLQIEPVGTLPDDAEGELKPFFISHDSLSGHYYFQLAGVAEQDLRDLYAEPFFFKAIAVDLADETLAELERSQLERLTREADFLVGAIARRDQFAELEARGELTDEQIAVRADDSQRLEEIQPSWLLWADPLSSAVPLPADDQSRSQELARRAAQTLPRVLARFDNDAATPFLIERKIGEGSVLFVSTGMYSAWNTLPKTNAMLVFDRILRTHIRETLPERNFIARERIDLRLPTNDRDVVVALYRPDEETPEILDTGFIGTQQRGVSVSDPLARGVYNVVAWREGAQQNDDGTTDTVWELPLTVTGQADESDLTPIKAEDFERRVASNNVRWVGAGEEISLAGVQIRGQDMWWWLVLAILLLLLGELAMLAWPTMKHRQT